MPGSRRNITIPSVLLIAGILLGLFALPPRTGRTSPATVYGVLFDNAHVETGGNADWIISTSQPDPLLEDPNPQVETDWTGGISAWGVALQRTGRYSLKTTTSAITYGNGSNPLDLTHFDALVLPEPNSLFTSPEKTAIMAFVSSGGGLFMVADHNGSDRNSDGWDSLHIFNDLMNNSGVGNDPFGIQFDVLDISSENPNNDTPNPDPVLQGPFGTASGSIIRSGTTETINLAHNPNARGVIYRDNSPNTGTTGIFVARSIYGSGRIVAVGDSSAIDDGTCRSGNNCFNGWTDPAGQNNILFPNGTEWIAGGGPAGTPTNTPPPTNTLTRTTTPTRTSTPIPGATNTPTPSPTPTNTPAPGGSHLVINQLYGAGGATGAPWRNDFIELFNPTSAPVAMSNWSVQYASSTGNSWASTVLNATIPAGGYYLVQENSGGTNGALLPTPDASDDTAMSATTGKVALVNNTTLLACGAAGNSCIPNPHIIDYVGYGGASDFEGSGPTAATSNTMSVLRANGGCTDTNNNASDFATSNPITPRNSATALNLCVAPTTTPTFAPTRTNTSTATSTSTANASNTPTGTPTNTSTNTPTSTPTPTYTITPSDTPTSTLTTLPADTPTSTPTGTPTAEPFLVGHVLWLGRPPQPNSLQQLPVTLTLRMGAAGAEYPEQTTDVSGYFTVSAAGLPSGTYNWRVKGPKFLANAGTITLIGSPRTDAEMGSLRSGDANNDNAISSTDFSILKSTFGKSQGQPGYDDRADFTGDAAVSVSDFTILKSNFGLAGAPPIGP